MKKCYFYQPYGVVNVFLKKFVFASKYLHRTLGVPHKSIKVRNIACEWKLFNWIAIYQGPTTLVSTTNSSVKLLPFCKALWYFLWRVSCHLGMSTIVIIMVWYAI